MLEDQQEELACLHALGLLDEAEARAFLAETTGNEALRRTVTDLEETLTRLSLSTTSIQRPADELRHRLLERIDNEPARVTTDPHGLIEAITDRIRADRTLGGIVVQAGEGDAGITKSMSEPYINGERTESYGVIRFEANDFPTA